MANAKDDWEKLHSTKDDKDICLDISYSQSRGKFRVDVHHGAEKLSEEFNASYAPRFGMDVADTAQAYEIAEKLAEQLEKKLNL